LSNVPFATITPSISPVAHGGSSERRSLKTNTIHNQR